MQVERLPSSGSMRFEYKMEEETAVYLFIVVVLYYGIGGYDLLHL